MGAVGIPLLGLLGAGAVAGGTAYVTKKVIDGANNRSMAAANAVQPDIQSAIQQSNREKALLAQQSEYARQQATAKAQAALGASNRRRNLLSPGVLTSNSGLTGTPNVGRSILGN